MIHYTDDIDAWVRENGEEDASELALELCPKETKAMAKALRDFDKAFQQLRKTFPEANIYSAK